MNSSLSLIVCPSSVVYLNEFSVNHPNDLTLKPVNGFKAKILIIMEDNVTKQNACCEVKITPKKIFM